MGLAALPESVDVSPDRPRSHLHAAAVAGLAYRAL